MDKHHATAGALAIMMGSGAIADFELQEVEGELFVSVWLPPDRDGLHLRKHVAALLPGHIDEQHVRIVEQ
jgi:hypothetical protein